MKWIELKQGDMFVYTSPLNKTKGLDCCSLLLSKPTLDHKSLQVTWWQFSLKNNKIAIFQNSSKDDVPLNGKIILMRDGQIIDL